MFVSVSRLLKQQNQKAVRDLFKRPKQSVPAEVDGEVEMTCFSDSVQHVHAVAGTTVNLT